MKKTLLLLFVVGCFQLSAFEDYKSLTIADDQIYPVIEGNYNIIAVPNPQAGSAPELWVMSSNPYRLRAIGIDEPGVVFNQPNYPYNSNFTNIPLYGDPRPLPSEIPAGFYNVIQRPDGLSDLVHGQSLKYYKNIGTFDAPKFSVSDIGIAAEREELYAYAVMGHGEKFVGDVNEDGIPDLLFMHYNRLKETNRWTSRPMRIRPWEIVDVPEIGPSKDIAITGPFRGNDIEGQPTAKPWTLELRWAPGRYDSDGRLAFAAPRAVVIGTSDYPVVWEQYQSRAMARLVETEAGRFIMLIEPMGRVLALPILEADADSLHLGKAEPLLDGSPYFSALIKGGGTTGILDLNGDGVDEILIRGGAFGAVTVLAGTEPGNYKESAVLRRTGEGVSVFGLEVSVSERVDFDLDGYPDLLVGTAPGSLFIYRGTRNPLVYEGPHFAPTPEGFVFSLRAREHTNLQGPEEKGWGYLNPHAADYDGDGHMDILANDNTSYPVLYRGTGEGFALESAEPFTYRSQALPVQWRTKLAVIDAEINVLDSGKTCLAFIDLDRGLSIAIPKEPGSTEIEQIVPLLRENGESLILCGFNGQSGRTKISLNDWDGDGDWDIVYGTAGGLLLNFDPNFPYDNQEFKDVLGYRQQAQPYVWLNVGDSQNPVFESSGPRRIGLDAIGKYKNGDEYYPDLFKAGYHCFTIDPTHLDNDDKWDFIAADEHGIVLYFYSDEFVTSEPGKTTLQP